MPSDVEVFYNKVREHLGGKRTWNELNPVEQMQMVQAINIILGVCSQ